MCVCVCVCSTLISTWSKHQRFSWHLSGHRGMWIDSYLFEYLDLSRYLSFYRIRSVHYLFITASSDLLSHNDFVHVSICMSICLSHSIHINHLIIFISIYPTLFIFLSLSLSLYIYIYIYIYIRWVFHSVHFYCLLLFISHPIRVLIKKTETLI